VRTERGRFAKGSSGNPQGQPQWVREFRDAFARRCAPLAEQVLHDVLSGSEPDAKVSDKVHAADTVLKYVLPKPTQQVEVTVDDKREAFAGLTTAELAELAKQKPETEES
jgi:hypothetical protein